MIKVLNPQETLNTPTSVALGTFDGLHKGHMTIINKLVSEGKFKRCVFTFSNSPAFVATKIPVKYILSQQEKEKLLCDSGVEYLVTSEFNKELMSLSAEEFFQKYILEILDAKEIYVGYNYTFGKNKSGTTGVLKNLCDKHGIKLSIIPPVLVDGETVSSTRIRQTIFEGRLDSTADMLGRGVTIDGVVCQGNKVGRTIGFPTVNIGVDNLRALPPDGVYSAKVQIDSATYNCIANLGARPTVSTQGERLFEAYISGFDGDLYGEYLVFELVAKIRDICKFDSVDALRAQLEADVKKIEQIL